MVFDIVVSLVVTESLLIIRSNSSVLPPSLVMTTVWVSTSGGYCCVEKTSRVSITVVLVEGEVVMVWVTTSGGGVGNVSSVMSIDVLGAASE